MKHQNKILSALCLLTLASCGGDSGESSSKNTNQENRQEMQDNDGTYKAILRPYNFELSGWLPNGMTDIKIEGDEIEIKSWLDDSANVVHMQNIHLGTVCPTAANDFNKDGFVDYAETLKVTKSVFIPLDSDVDSLSTQDSYSNGNFTYFQKASLNDLSKELSGSNLNLEGKVIIVSGIATSRSLPSTTASNSGMSPQASMPIACGVIQRMP